ncbi:MAG: RidA family protein [Oscillospiraceae bacterium]|nr:RidA family protein [Oscillospiraceae bacterium]
MKEKWTTPNAPVPSPWIAQVSRDDTLGIAYISGLISQKGDDVIFGLSAAEETKIILDNLKTIVTDMGLTMDHVIKTNIFLTDMADFDEMNAVYREYFNHENPPARQCVQAGVWGNLKVEISSVVVLR